jgi:hypothetical protein
MKNYWLDNRIDSTFRIKSYKGIELLPLHDVKLSHVTNNTVEILFADDKFDQSMLMNVNGNAVGYLDYYDITDVISTSWTLRGLSLTGVYWCEVSKPFKEVLALAQFNFKSVTKR